MSPVQELPFKHVVSRFKWNIGVAAVLAIAAISPIMPFGANVVRAAGSQHFSATGSDQSFTVPSGVTQIQVYARGGGGGSNGYNYGSPGKGAYVSATLTVTPGDVLRIVVGNAGSASSTSSTYGGGARGGTTEWWSASGGGASDIRLGGTALADRVIVAGGGGGSAAFANGGDGGAPVGSNALQASSDGTNAQGGRGGTQSAGGAGGNAAGGGCYNNNGSAGSLGLGGSGATPSPGGSGGGGGYYGGGGGGGGCNSGGGGGGSSWVNSSLSSSFSYAVTTTVSAGCIEISWPVGASASSCLRTSSPTTTAATTSTAPTTTAPTTTAPTTTLASTTTSTAVTTTTVASNQTTTTLAGGSNQASVTTTVAPVNTLVAPANTSSAPVTTVRPTTTTTTTTTTPSSEQVDAPEAVDVDPGAAAALVDGESVAMTLSRSNNVVSISGAGITGSVSLIDESGSVIPLDAEGNLRVDGNASAVLTFEGAKAGSTLELWVFSDPQQLMKTKVGKDGKVRMTVPMPDDLPSGDHKFVATLTNYADSDMSVSLGFVVGDDGSGVSISGVIFAVLGLGIFFALAIPARRRLRRTAS